MGGGDSRGPLPLVPGAPATPSEHSSRCALPVRVPVPAAAQERRQGRGQRQWPQHCRIKKRHHRAYARRVSPCPLAYLQLPPCLSLDLRGGERAPAMCTRSRSRPAPPARAGLESRRSGQSAVGAGTNAVALKACRAQGDKTRSPSPEEKLEDSQASRADGPETRPSRRCTWPHLPGPTVRTAAAAARSHSTRSRSTRAKVSTHVHRRPTQWHAVTWGLCEDWRASAMIWNMSRCACAARAPGARGERREGLEGGVLKSSSSSSSSDLGAACAVTQPPRLGGAKRATWYTTPPWSGSARVCRTVTRWPAFSHTAEPDGA